MSADWCEIPKTWLGQRVFVVGGGPSLEDMPWDQLRGKNVVACNAAAFSIPKGIAEWAVFGDKLFLKHFRKQLRDYVSDGGKLINATGRKPTDENHWMLQVKRLNGRKAWGLDTDPGILRWNRSTGGCAIDVAFHLGASEIVLLGYDMSMNGDRHNWHQAYESHYVERNKKTEAVWMPRPAPTIYREMMARAFGDIKRDADKYGLKIWNANSKSKLTVFEFIPREEALR